MRNRSLHAGAKKGSNLAPCSGLSLQAHEAAKQHSDVSQARSPEAPISPHKPPSHLSCYLQGAGSQVRAFEAICTLALELDETDSTTSGLTHSGPCRRLTGSSTVLALHCTKSCLGPGRTQIQDRAADIGKEAAVGRPAAQKPCNGRAVRELAVHSPPSECWDQSCILQIGDLGESSEKQCMHEPILSPYFGIPAFPSDTQAQRAFRLPNPPCGQCRAIPQTYQTLFDSTYR